MIVNESDLGIINVSDQQVIRLGRVEDGNDWILPHPAVSAHHAHIEKRSDGKWWVSDLESDHGVYVNYQRVTSDGHPILLGIDTLWIAPYALRLTNKDQSTQPRPAHLKLDLVNVRREVKSRILLDLSGTPLTFSPGEFIAIVGGSGAGKSTLLKSILGMDTIPSKGRIGDVYFNNLLLVHDSNIQSFAPLNTIMGYVPQQDDSIHFKLSAYEALEFAARMRFAADLAPDERSRRIQAVLASVRLDREDLQRKPIHQLSGGQRKRVNVAMELLAEPRLLFLDEPTSGLDPGLDLEMMRLLKGWAKGEKGGDPKTIVLITHATENVRLCDYVVLLGGVHINSEERGGCVLYFGAPGESADKFFGLGTYSEIYLDVASPEKAGSLHGKLIQDAEWSKPLWDRSRTKADIEESRALGIAKGDLGIDQRGVDVKNIRRQFKILAQRYWRILRRDTGAFIFQLLQGILVALLLWGVASPDALTAAGVRTAPTTLFILCIAATWLGTLNATKEIVRERRIFGRERRYGLSASAYVLSKVAVLGGMGFWQIGGLVAITVLYFTPESHVGTFGRLLPESLQFPGTLELEWFITLELLLLAGLSLGLCISAFSRSLDQATMLMFPAMLVQILLSGLLFDVGPLAWSAFTHWGLQALGNSLNLEALYASAGKSSDPILNVINLSGNALTLLGYWLILVVFIIVLISITVWRQGWTDKARIPED